MKHPHKAAIKPESPAGVVHSGDADLLACSHKHLRLGWWSLLVFLTLGIVLEGLHGFKVGSYLNPSNSTRRLMWTLAHAHGTLLALVHLAFGFTIRLMGGWEARLRGMASACLTGAGILIPCGFFLGGTVIHGGDPGAGIFLVPVGAIMLLIGVFLAARKMS